MFQSSSTKTEGSTTPHLSEQDCSCFRLCLGLRSRNSCVARSARSSIRASISHAPSADMSILLRRQKAHQTLVRPLTKPKSHLGCGGPLPMALVRSASVMEVFPSQTFLRHHELHLRRARGLSVSRHRPMLLHSRNYHRCQVRQSVTRRSLRLVEAFYGKVGTMPDAF